MDEIEDIEQLELDQEAWVNEFLAALLVINSRLLDEFERLIDRLQLNGGATTSEEWRSNLRQTTLFRAELTSYLVNQAGLGEAVRKLTERMGEGAGRLNTYFAAIDPAFSASEYGVMLQNLTSQTVQLLSGSVPDMLYSRPLGDILDWNILSKSTASELRSVLRTQLAADSALTKSLGQQASDLLYTFSRGYAKTVAEGLNLKHYYYMGTQIATSRSFCIDRLGKVYTEAEVEAWADLIWSGKMAGTTKKTIFWYLGGYRCKHRLLPISKQQYDQIYKLRQANGKTHQ
ncbi:hypothetical protein [Tellurirhabdus bombi]|uniref:hypothetical protein n=1 Tax=Tellurirhabdus bombi TaxID=2907205 RepID=UPI001F3CD500|nr:hypothetical protein [Tellurirhabdus bombi]